MVEIDFYIINMVFAKKKYPDEWQKKVKLAARTYFEYDDQWQDDHVAKKNKTLGEARKRIQLS